VRFSVVIPALNEAEVIRRAALSAWGAGASEVIVADGGSDDQTAVIAAACGCRVTSAPRGRASQQNAGAYLATGDVLVFLHADGALAPQVGRQLDDALSGQRAVWGAFRQSIEAPHWIYRWLETGNAQRAMWLGMPYGDQALFMRRQVYRDLGGFAQVPLMEDVLLSQRLRRRSWPVLLSGPVYVSPRRWQLAGVMRQTVRNWLLVAAFSCGVSPHRLAAWYRRHDQA
jgi:rSAM/selenodomain-associated transferase 2